MPVGVVVIVFCLVAQGSDLHNLTLAPLFHVLFQCPNASGALVAYRNNFLTVR